MTDLDQKALVEAKSAAMQALGYRHGDTVVIGNIWLNIGGAVQSAITAYLAALPPSPAVVPEAPLKDDEGHEWPARLSIRDTKLYDDLSGPGQRIYTTAGRGYKRVEYVRADLSASPSPPALDGAGRDAVIEEIAKHFDRVSEEAEAQSVFAIYREIASEVRSLKETP